MKKILNTKAVLVFALCAVMALTYTFAGHKTKVEAADSASGIQTSYVKAENNDEEIWYEMIDDAIADKADAYEEAGTEYTISDEYDIDDGYFYTVNAAGESTVVAGIYIDGTYYIVTLTSDQAISNEEAESTIYDDVCEQIVEAE